jgi:4-diphosphocytidyl-2-C-methyl-D-erythritol kinase
MTSLTLPSFAKINWVLEVLGRRADGYHELRTILQTVSVADGLRFTPTGGEIEITSDHPDVPCDETNLIHRAAALLREATGARLGVRVELTKRIPMGAGLGGGSGNAAVTLLALERLWGVKVAARDLFRLGARLGADVPSFLLGGASLGVGRGDEVYPLPDINFEHLLLVNPGLHVPTREIYGGLPPELTSPDPAAKMPLSLQAAYLSVARPDEFLTSLRNDLERPALGRYPLIAEVKRRLLGAGARAALMAGSGSTVFAVFESGAARERARGELSETGWWCAAARTLSRDEYKAAISGAPIPGSFGS